MSAVQRYNLKANHNDITISNTDDMAVQRYNLKANHNSNLEEVTGNFAVQRYNLKANHNHSRDDKSYWNCCAKIQFESKPQLTHNF